MDQSGTLGIVLFFSTFAPFLTALFNHGILPPRAFINVPLVISAISYLALNCKSQIVRGILITLTVITAFEFSVVNNRLALSKYMNFRADTVLSTRILARLDNLRSTLPKSSTHSAKSLPLEIVGYLHRPQSNVFVQKDVIGTSFYFQDEGSIARVIPFFHSMGVYDYRKATIKERKSIIERALKMPIWPAAGSVAFVNDIAVIKFGNYSASQYSSLHKNSA